MCFAIALPNKANRSVGLPYLKPIYLTCTVVINRRVITDGETFPELEGKTYVTDTIVINRRWAVPINALVIY
ncbi:MAG TPA: hypothetical protein V6D14_06295 [Coleofasciculaceae cyanobacterium]